MPIGRRKGAGILTACGQSPSMAFGYSKSCAFHGSCTPGTSSMRCGRLFVHSLLAACGQSPSLAFGRSKSRAFHGTCAPGTGSLRCNRLWKNGLLHLMPPPRAAIRSREDHPLVAEEGSSNGLPPQTGTDRRPDRAVAQPHSTAHCGGSPGTPGNPGGAPAAAGVADFFWITAARSRWIRAYSFADTT